MSDWPVTLSQLGLILDAIGASLIFFYIVPANMPHVRQREYDEKVEAKRMYWIKFKACAGYILLMAGFILQFIGSMK